MVRNRGDEGKLKLQRKEIQYTVSHKSQVFWAQIVLPAGVAAQQASGADGEKIAVLRIDRAKLELI